MYSLRTFLLLHFFIIHCFYFVQYSFSQNPQTDSLLNVLKSEREDTNKVNILNQLSRQSWQVGNFEMAMQYAKEQLFLAQKNNFKKGLAYAGINIGNIYWYWGKYPEALENYLAVLKLGEDMKNKKTIAKAYWGIGLIYQYQGKYTEAISNYFASKKIKEELGDKEGIADFYNNIGNIYRNQGNYPEALENHLSSLKIKEEIKDKAGVAYSFNNIGNIYYNLKNYPDALKNYLASLKIKKEIGDQQGIASTYNNIGVVNTLLKNYSEARKYLNNGLKIAKQIDSKNDVMESYYSLSELNGIVGNWKSAYEYHQLYSQIKDSIFNEDSNKQITEMQTKYETEKKEQQIKLLNKDKEIQRKDLQRQKTIRNAVAGGLIMVLLFSFVLINRLLLIRKQKKVIEIERGKSEKLLLNILPKDTAEELKTKNAVTPKRYDQVTVMFTDFKGFTTIAEKMSAEELVSELDFIFKKFDEIISKYPIEKIKTIGDAYMCAGGLPVANTTNPIDIVMAALEIQEFMCLTPNPSPKERGELPPLRGGLGWGLRIGIHTGSVIAGVVGDKKFAYDIWGDTVNTASRMESSGEAGKVNISGTTYKTLQNLEFKIQNLKFQFRGKIPAKNKGEIEMYFVEKIS